MRLLVGELGATPLIGFAGAPFTLASYLIEGGPSRTYVKTKAMMYGEPALWDSLCSRLADITLSFLRTQIAAGVSAVQLFDSWAGALSLADYRRYVLPHSAKVLAGLASAGVPRIHFGVGTSILLEAMGAAGADVVGRRLAHAARPGHPDHRPGQGRAGQPGSRRCCSRPGTWSRAETRRVLAEGRSAPGHVFNLGHGVLPETDPDVLTRVVAPRCHGSASRSDGGLGYPGGRSRGRPETVGGVRKRVAVVGGGIAGLAAAVRIRDLAPADTEIIVYEQSGALGGKLRTGELGGATVERGAESFLVGAPGGGESAAVRFARRLGLGGCARASRRLGGPRWPSVGGWSRFRAGRLSAYPGI